MLKPTFFISRKSDYHRLSSGCVKCLESTDMSCSMQNRPEVLYKQAKVALGSFSNDLQFLVFSKVHTGNFGSVYM